MGSGGQRHRAARRCERAECGKERSWRGERTWAERELGRAGSGGAGRLGREGKGGPDGLELLGWVLGFLMGFYFPFLSYPISKTNKQSLNSNTTLNSNHTQIIKTMHQHECNTKKKLNL